MSTYIVTSTPRGDRYHRATCKKVNAAQVSGTVLDHPDVDTPATCCKPQPSERKRQQDELKAAKAVDEMHAAADRVDQAIAEAVGRNVEVFDPTPAADRIARLALAKDEAKALKEAEAHGGPAPATPNLDVIEGKTEAPEKARKESGKLVDRRAAHPLYFQAVDMKRNGYKRGKGTPISPEDLAAYIAKVREERPQATAKQENEVAYFITGLAVSHDRFMAAWAAVEQGQPPVQPKRQAAETSSQAAEINAAKAAAKAARAEQKAS